MKNNRFLSLFSAKLLIAVCIEQSTKSRVLSACIDKLSIRCLSELRNEQPRILIAANQVNDSIEKNLSTTRYAYVSACQRQ